MVKILRVLRVLRPLRAINRAKGLKVSERLGQGVLLPWQSCRRLWGRHRALFPIATTHEWKVPNPSALFLEWEGVGH